MRTMVRAVELWFEVGDASPARPSALKVVWRRLLLAGDVNQEGVGFTPAGPAPGGEGKSRGGWPPRMRARRAGGNMPPSASMNSEKYCERTKGWLRPSLGDLGVNEGSVSGDFWRTWSALRLSTRSRRRMAFCVCGFQVGETFTISAYESWLYMKSRVAFLICACSSFFPLCLGNMTTMVSP